MALTLTQCVTSGDIAEVEKLLKAGANPNTAERHGDYPLYIAAENGYTKIVEMLLAHDAVIDVTNFRGYTALRIAAEKGYIDIVKMLLAKKASLKQPESQVTTSLYVAVKNGHAEIVEMLLSAGANPNTAERLGDYPIYIAAEKGYTKIVEMLLAHDAVIDVTNFRGYTALRIAAEKGYIDIVRMLLNKGANPSDGPLHIAVKKGYIEIVEMLLNAGANPNVAEHYRDYPLYIAAEKDDIDTVRMLLAHGAVIDVTNFRGHTALYIAAEKNYIDMVRMLLSAGASPSDGSLHIAVKNGHIEIVEMLLKNNSDSDQASQVLPLAVENGYTEIVRMLLAKDADPNQSTVTSYTLLQIASENGYTDMVKMLLAHGANPNDVGRRGHSPLYLAVNKGHREIVEILLAKGANPNNSPRLLFTTIEKDYTEIAEMLLSCGADPHETNFRGRTALHAATEKGNRKIVEMLIAAGVDPNTVNYNNIPPVLFLAVDYGHVEMVEVLLANGADPNKVYYNGGTLLHIATIKKYTEVLKKLLIAGADTDVPDSEGSSALHYAVQLGHIEIVKILLTHSRQINLNIKDKFGYAPLHCALANKDMVEILINAGADPNLQNGVEGSPFCIVAQSGSVEIAMLLLEYGVLKAEVEKNLSVLLHNVLRKSGKAAFHLFLAQLINEKKYKIGKISSITAVIEIISFVFENFKEKKSLQLLETFCRIIESDLYKKAIYFYLVNNDIPQPFRDEVIKYFDIQSPQSIFVMKEKQYFKSCGLAEVMDAIEDKHTTLENITAKNPNLLNNSQVEAILTAVSRAYYGGFFLSTHYYQKGLEELILDRLAELNTEQPAASAKVSSSVGSYELTSQDWKNLNEVTRENNIGGLDTVQIYRILYRKYHRHVSTRIYFVNGDDVETQLMEQGIQESHVAYDVFILPLVHKEVPHATAVVVDRKKQRIYFIDSLGFSIPDKKKQVILNLFPHFVLYQNKIKQQENKWECAIHAIANIQDILTGNISVDSGENIVSCPNIHKRNLGQLLEKYYQALRQQEINHEKHVYQNNLWLNSLRSMARHKNIEKKDRKSRSQESSPQAEKNAADARALYGMFWQEINKICDQKIPFYQAKSPLQLIEEVLEINPNNNFALRISFALYQNNSKLNSVMSDNNASVSQFKEILMDIMAQAPRIAITYIDDCSWYNNMVQSYIKLGFEVTILSAKDYKNAPNKETFLNNRLSKVDLVAMPGSNLDGEEEVSVQLFLEHVILKTLSQGKAFHGECYGFQRVNKFLFDRSYIDKIELLISELIISNCLSASENNEVILSADISKIQEEIKNNRETYNALIRKNNLSEDDNQHLSSVLIKYEYLPKILELVETQLQLPLSWYVFVDKLLVPLLPEDIQKHHRYAIPLNQHEVISVEGSTVQAIVKGELPTDSSHRLNIPEGKLNPLMKKNFEHESVLEGVESCYLLPGGIPQVRATQFHSSSTINQSIKSSSEHLNVHCALFFERGTAAIGARELTSRKSNRVILR